MILLSSKSFMGVSPFRRKSFLAAGTSAYLTPDVLAANREFDGCRLVTLRAIGSGSFLPLAGCRVCWARKVPSSHHLRSAGAAGDRVGGISCASPSAIATGLESNVIVAGCKPSRVAVNRNVPGIRVERIATRLMPPSVLR